MKKILPFFALFVLLTLPQGAFAWTYEGLGSLNPFTNFGRGFGNDCGYKIERCHRPKLTKCEKLHGVKIIRGKNTGCAAPVEPIYMKVMPDNGCTNCRRAF